MKTEPKFSFSVYCVLSEKQIREKQIEKQKIVTNYVYQLRHLIIKKIAVLEGRRQSVKWMLNVDLRSMQINTQKYSKTL